MLTILWPFAAAAQPRQGAAAATGQGGGAPFAELQSQITILTGQLAAVTEQLNALAQRVTDLDTRVTAEMADLRARLVGLAARVTEAETRLTTAEAGITSVSDALTALEIRVSTAEAAITELGATVDALTAALDDVRTQLQQEAAQARAALLNLEASLLALIHSNTANIAALQGQVAGITEFLANLSSYECEVGEAARAVSPTGLLVCTTLGSGESGGTVQIQAQFSVAANTSGVGQLTCPTGTSLVSGGWDHWPITDQRQIYSPDRVTTAYIYVANYTVYTTPTGTIPVPNYALQNLTYDYGSTTWVPYEASRITRDRASGNTYSIGLLNSSGYYRFSAFATISVVCRIP